MARCGKGVQYVTLRSKVLIVARRRSLSIASSTGLIDIARNACRPGLLLTVPCRQQLCISKEALQRVKIWPDSVPFLSFGILTTKYNEFSGYRDSLCYD